VLASWQPENPEPVGYSLLTILRSVTQRSDERQSEPWRELFQRVHDAMLVATDTVLSGLRRRAWAGVFKRQPEARPTCAKEPWSRRADQPIRNLRRGEDSAEGPPINAVGLARRDDGGVGSGHALTVAMTDPALRRANYEDVLAATADRIAEIVHGVLHLSPRPGGPQSAAGSALGEELGPPFSFPTLPVGAASGCHDCSEPRTSH
jgi:hypothetical protein